MRSRPGKSRILPASPTDLRTLVENYIYPLIVCEEEGKIVFYNGAAQEAFGEEELLGRPLPPHWMDSEEVVLRTADEGEVPFRLIWDEIMWDGNVAWYLVAVPALAKSDDVEEEARRLRAELEQSQELALSEQEGLKSRLEEAERQASELDELRARLEHSQEMSAVEVQELKQRLESSQNEADGMEGLREELERSTEMVAVESEKRQNAETERDRLEAKLRDLHQRSLSKLEAARNALEAERAERDELAQRLARLKDETDSLRHSLEEKSFEVEEVRSRSGEHFGRLEADLEERNQSLLARTEELSEKSRQLSDAEGRLQELEHSLRDKSEELLGAEDRLDRFRREYEELDREMVAAQEQNALLRAKLQTAESRMERYQRLMDSDSSDSESEVEELRSRVEVLQIELAALSASQAASGPSSTMAERVSTNGTTESGHFEHELQSARAVIEELRFHRELEYQQAQTSLRDLQRRLAVVQVDGPEALEAENSEEAVQLERRLSELEGELQDTHLSLRQTREELVVRAEIADSVPHLREKILLLEQQLQQVPVSAGGVPDEQVQQRIRELEAEVQRARTEASPEELQLARHRISELEARLASQPHAMGSGGNGEVAQRNRELESELTRTREQLAELNQELRRTLEGDRETKKLAYADQLTGLPNLNLTGQYLQVCFERSGRSEGALALILIDLDHFRRVNDALGQKAGDQLLKEVGARLQRSVTEKDTAIARRGEDEFMVVAFMEGGRVDGEALQARVRGIAHNLLNELAKPFDILDQRVQVTASLGVALYPGPATSRVELLEQSEHAMYKAKENGRARVSFYTDEMHQSRERRRYLETELHQAVAQRQFGLVYQPIYDIASSKIVGVEALLRWSHPHRGLLEPKEFLEAAEDSGVIVAIGELIIQEALEVAKQKFMKRRFLSLNLSFRQLIDSGFSARFMKHLQIAGVPPHEIIVEISEKTAGVDPERVKNTLAHLAHWGVGIALDDFGTGSSQLTHLTDLNLRVLKIDRSVIARIPDDRGATKLCKAITQMSNAMEVPVLAEGVETREQLSQIAAMGCQYAQGLILNGPLSVNQLIQVL